MRARRRFLRNVLHQNPLHVAEANKQDDAVRFIFPLSDLGHVADPGHTPSMRAAYSGHLRCMELIHAALMRTPMAASASYRARSKSRPRADTWRSRQ